MTAVRSLFFYVGYLSSLLIYGVFCCLVGWLMPLRLRYRVFTRWNAFALFWLRLTCGVHCNLRGVEHIPAEAYVLVCNHQSPWETLFIAHRLYPMCAILKKELLAIPIFGWALRLLHPIAIDRSKRSQARKTILQQGRLRLQEGLSVVIFPEGTRVAPGEEKRYSSGGAELAISAGVKIVPAVHNAGLHWPAHKLHKYPGTIEMIVGEPVDTLGREPKELTRELEQWSRETLSRISANS